MRRRLTHTLIAVVTAAAVVLGAQTAAQAERRGADGDYTSWVIQDTSTGFCLAEVNLTWSDKGYYASGWFSNYQAGWSCTGWLERSTNFGSTWSKVSGDHIVYSVPGVGDTAETGLYYDGNGYLARGCFKLSFAGAATHCSDPL